MVDFVACLGMKICRKGISDGKFGPCFFLLKSLRHEIEQRTYKKKHTASATDKQ